MAEKYNFDKIVKRENTDSVKYDLRKAFKKTLNQLHILGENLFGYVASTAGHEKGSGWVDRLMHYVQANFDYLSSFLESDIPQTELSHPEATYLAWLDFRKTGLKDKEIKRKLIFEAGLGLSHGPVFGTGGEVGRFGMG